MHPHAHQLHLMTQQHAGLPPAPPPTFVEQYSHLSTVLSDHGGRQAATAPIPVSTLKFDESEELLWMGNTYGHVTSYYSDQLTKYTSFAVTQSEPVLQLITGDFGLLCLTKDELKLKHRRGPPIFSYNSTTLRDMLCMSRQPSQMILLGGQSQTLIEFDLERMRQVRSTDLDSKENGCCIIRQHPKFVCCADLNGRITLRSTNNLNVNHSFATYSGQISDFDVHGNYLVTCGYAAARPTPERLLMVYDLRTCRLVTPIRSPFPPVLLRFVPAFTSKFCLVAPMGEFQLLDCAASAVDNCTVYTHQVQMAPEATITCMDVSSSGQVIAFGDNLGLINLYGTTTNASFNQYSRPTEFPDPQDPVPPIDTNDYITPLSIVPQTYFDPYEKLISETMRDYDTGKHYRIPKVDPKILESMHNRGDVGYAANPFKNQGRISYIRGRIGVVGLTKISDDDFETVKEPIEPLELDTTVTDEPVEESSKENCKKDKNVINSSVESEQKEETAESENTPEQNNVNAGPNSVESAAVGGISSK